jgi:Ser/Thr protein kinase RdoA (MazF antagonist)
VLEFDQLTVSGRTSRLRQLADAALSTEFGIDARRISLLSAYSFNTFFRADTADWPLAVRIGEVRIHADGVEEVEAHWLAAIQADTHLTVPALLPDRHGRHVAMGTHPAVPSGLHCSVMTWVGGRPARDRFDISVARQLGIVQATLHEHASTYRSPHAPTGIVANRVIYFADTSLLSSYESAHGSLFREAIDRVQRHLDKLWSSPPHPPHLIHGDLGPNNVMRWRNRLTPIDFQDLQFGFDVKMSGPLLPICDATTTRR